MSTATGVNPCQRQLDAPALAFGSVIVEAERRLVFAGRHDADRLYDVAYEYGITGDSFIGQIVNQPLFEET